MGFYIVMSLGIANPISRWGYEGQFRGIYTFCVSIVLETHFDRNCGKLVKMVLMTYANSEDPEQTVHMRSLIYAFTVRRSILQYLFIM